MQTLVFFHVQDDVPEVVASPALFSLPDVSHALLEQHFNPTNATTATQSPPHECQTRLNKSHHDDTAAHPKAQRCREDRGAPPFFPHDALLRFLFGCNIMMLFDSHHDHDATVHHDIS